MSYFDDLSLELKELDRAYFKENHIEHGHFKEIYKRTVVENVKNRKCVKNAISDFDKGFLNDLWEGHVDDVFMDKVCSEIQENADTTQILYRINFFDQLIKHKIIEGNKVTSVPLPMYIVLSLTKSRIFYKNFGDVEKFRGYQEALKHLLLYYEKMNNYEKVAFMLVSSVIFGGLLNIKELLVFSNMSYRDLKHKDDKYWVHIPCDNKRNSSGLSNKFYISPFTLMIIRLNITSISDVDKQNTAWGLEEVLTDKMLTKNIKIIFNKINMGEANKFNKLSGFLSTVKTAVSLSIPSYVLDYRTGRNTSFSLNKWADERFMFGKILSERPNPVKKRNLSKKAKRDLLKAKTEYNAPYNEDIITSEISKLIEKELFDELKILLTSNKTISAPLFYLSQWCIALHFNRAPNRVSNNSETVTWSNGFVQPS